MTREIKFRAWSTKENTWFADTDWSIMLDGTLLDKYQSDFGSENVVLMQYTGVKDKNGVEIYEGDIVKVQQHTHLSIPDFEILEGNYKVLFNMGSYGMIIQNYCYWDLCSFGYEVFLNHGRIDKVKIIGNIYENPELLPTTTPQG